MNQSKQNDILPEVDDASSLQEARDYYHRVFKKFHFTFIETIKKIGFFKKDMTETKENYLFIAAMFEDLTQILEESLKALED